MADAPAFAELFAASRRSAVHLETRDGYDVTDPMFIAWKNGHRYDPADRGSWWRPWLELTADTVARGVRLRRARIVSEPVSEYIRFEYDVTFTNVAAGEQVRWLPRREATGLVLPGNDFWIFDDTVLLINHFNGDGISTGAELCDDADVLRLCSSAFDAVWQRAVPHADYIPT